jgi:hypothetical protein
MVDGPMFESSRLLSQFIKKCSELIQPVLIVRDRPSQDLIDQCYFYKVVEAMIS